MKAGRFDEAVTELDAAMDLAPYNLGYRSELAGAYVATGHGRQGILMSTATGRAMADLIVDGRTDCIDLTPFDPARFGAGVE